MEHEDISSAIQTKIRQKADELWNEDPDMREMMIKDEVQAYQELQTLEIEDVPGEVLRDLQVAGEREHPADYSEQRDYVRTGASRYLYIQRLNRRIEPMKELLIRMEGIIGNECYNRYSQIYGPGGVWEGEGRSYRFPVTFVVDDTDEERRKVSSDVDAGVLMTGRYKFGANELNIFRALARVVEMLRDEYNFDYQNEK